MLSHQPEEIHKALRQPHLHLPKGPDPDAHLPLIAATLRASAAEIEPAKIEQLGGLASAIFDRIATVEGEASGVFTAEAAAPYATSIGREVCVEETRPVFSALMDTGVVMRRGNGRCVVR